MAPIPPMPNIRIDRPAPGRLRFLSLAAAGIGVASGAYKYGLYNVDGGHRAIIFNKIFGVQEMVKGEGTHLKWPFLDVPIIFNVRARPEVFESVTGSRDLQRVRIILRVLARPDPQQLPTIFRTLGPNWARTVLDSVAEEVLRSVVAQFNASQLLTMREQVSRLIERNLKRRAQDFNILLDDISIIHLEFGREYTKAVEAKQVAQQEAERARFIVERAKQEKKSTIIRAEGEAKSAQMIGDAMRNNPAFVQLRRVQAAREIAGLVKTSNNRVYLDADTLQLNLGAVEEGDMSVATKVKKEEDDQNSRAHEWNSSKREVQ